jgi:hypothetical protein
VNVVLTFMISNKTASWYHLLFVIARVAVGVHVAKQICHSAFYFPYVHYKVLRLPQQLGPPKVSNRLLFNTLHYLWGGGGMGDFCKFSFFAKQICHSTFYFPYVPMCRNYFNDGDNASNRFMSDFCKFFFQALPQRNLYFWFPRTLTMNFQIPLELPSCHWLWRSITFTFFFCNYCNFYMHMRLEFNVYHLQCVTSKTARLAVGEHVVKQTSHSACFFPL